MQGGVVEESLRIDKQLSSQHRDEGVLYISLKDSLCNSEGCLVRVGDKIETDLLVFDYGHLTRAGARYVTQRLLAPELPGLIEDFPVLSSPTITPTAP
jgi:hypothetical protein